MPLLCSAPVNVWLHSQPECRRQRQRPAQTNRRLRPLLVQRPLSRRRPLDLRPVRRNRHICVLPPDEVALRHREDRLPARQSGQVGGAAGKMGSRADQAGHLRRGPDVLQLVVTFCVLVRVEGRLAEAARGDAIACTLQILTIPHCSVDHFISHRPCEVPAVMKSDIITTAEYMSSMSPFLLVT